MQPIDWDFGEKPEVLAAKVSVVLHMNSARIKIK